MVILMFAILILVIVVGAYAACRAIDHHFTMKEVEKETAEKHGYNEELLRHAFEDVEWLTTDMITKWNDELQKAFKNLG